ncbi:MAG TPA: CBS domain-containing protein [Gemmatimonadaceae bacterium]|jgi:CBS domain-containing protein
MIRLRDIMTRDVLTVHPDMTLRDAMELLAQQHVSGAPVVVGDKVVGVVSASDLLSFASSTPTVPTERAGEVETVEWEEPADWIEGEEAAGDFFLGQWSDAGADVSERFNEVSGPEWDLFAEHTVSEAMTRTLCALPSDTFVDAAADVMRAAGIHRVLVMDAGKLSGIATMTDIASAVADHKLTAKTYVFAPESKFPSRGWP